MSVPAGKVPIFESARAAVRFAWDNKIALAPAAAVAAVLAALFTMLGGPMMLSGGNPFMSGAFQALAATGLALFTTAAVRRALDGPAGLDASLAGLTLKVYAAMAVIGFFMWIVFVVSAIPGVLLVGMALAPYVAELEAAQNDVDATFKILRDAFSANPTIFIGIAFLYGAIWMALTSRLYLCAPASVAENRIATFETWRWTQGNMLRIIAARLVLLTPAVFAAGLLQSVFAAVLGVPTGEPGAMVSYISAQPALYAVFAFLNAFVTFIVYASLEAGLASYLYRGLKPPA